MTNDEIRNLLAKFEYSAKWVEYGFLDGDFLLEQGEDFDSTRDGNTGQYRYEAFRAYLGYHGSLDPGQLTRYIDLAVHDKDQLMGEAALDMLLQWPGLTPDQFEFLSDHPAFRSPFLHKMAVRIRLLGEIRNHPIDGESFTRFLASGDEAVQRALLERADISRGQLEQIRDAGTVPLRNIAEARLRTERG